MHLEKTFYFRIKMNFFSQSILYFLFLSSLFAMAFVRYQNTAYIKSLFLSAISYGRAETTRKSDINNKTLINTLLSINFYLSVSIFLIISADRFQLIPPDKNRFLIFAGTFVGVILFFVSIMLANIVSAYIFKIKDIAGDFNRHNFFIYHSLGICLLAVNILTAFSTLNDFFLYGGFIVAGIFFLLKIFRMIQINLSKQIKNFYLFLYLCTVEILPILYIVKILSLVLNTAT